MQINVQNICANNCAKLMYKTEVQYLCANNEVSFRYKILMDSWWSCLSCRCISSLSRSFNDSHSSSLWCQTKHCQCRTPGTAALRLPPEPQGMHQPVPKAYRKWCVVNEMFTFEIDSEMAILDCTLECWKINSNSDKLSTHLVADSDKLSKIWNRQF